MSKIKFNSYELIEHPDKITLAKKVKYSASVLTYSGIGCFNWGATIVGKELEISWAGMTTVEFDILNEFYENDDTVVFDPKDGSLKTYNVKIKSFDGTYLIETTYGSSDYRGDVEMVILILSEV